MVFVEYINCKFPKFDTPTLFCMSLNEMGAPSCLDNSYHTSNVNSNSVRNMRFPVDGHQTHNCSVRIAQNELHHDLF
ncbi:MAG: hypothetical protein EU533_04470 [Promethearchaeota archaeon]|nr:MAG: hypothetical protein EU533_04470 [Candidatus Lokiarchaeota archaeon]